MTIRCRRLPCGGGFERRADAAGSHASLKTVRLLRPEPLLEAPLVGNLHVEGREAGDLLGSVMAPLT